jgi:hypothetical protein
MENSAHALLLCIFRDMPDQRMVENAAENLVRIHRIGFLLLKNDKKCRLGIKSKRASRIR